MPRPFVEVGQTSLDKTKFENPVVSCLAYLIDIALMFSSRFIAVRIRAGSQVIVMRSLVYIPLHLHEDVFAGPFRSAPFSLGSVIPDLSMDNFLPWKCLSPAQFPSHKPATLKCAKQSRVSLAFPSQKLTYKGNLCVN
jgi:hypothetical protein